METPEVASGARTDRAQLGRLLAALGPGDGISGFMRRIGQGDGAFVVLSDRYLRSPYCMFELSEVWGASEAEGEAFLRRVRVYSLPDAQAWAPLDRARCAASWKRQRGELKALIEEHGAEVPGELDLGRSS